MNQIQLEILKLAEETKLFFLKKDEAFETMVIGAGQQNPWFTEKEIDRSIEAILAGYLDETSLVKWLMRYPVQDCNPHQSIGIVAAGNIPLVVFHDILCAFASGCHACIKLSEKDQVLPSRWLDRVKELSPNHFSFERVTTMPAVDKYIITGSSLALDHYHKYLKGKPAILRGHRNSIAVLNGSESDEALCRLGEDVFSYYGLGCRSVTKLYLPLHFDIRKLIETWESKYSYLTDLNVYYRNYEYQKAIKLVNRIPFLDGGFALFEISHSIAPAISTVYYEYYNDLDDLHFKLEDHKGKIQCVCSDLVLDGWVTHAFGSAQTPCLWEYQDDLDTMEFLQND